MEIGPWVITKNPDKEAKDKPFLVTKRVNQIDISYRNIHGIRSCTYFLLISHLERE